MDLLGFIFVGAILWWIFSKFKSGYEAGRQDGGNKHCMTCGANTAPVTKIKGSIVIEIVLWLCFLIPGLIYSIWRLSSRHDACAACGSATIVPMGSPTALAQVSALAVINNKKCPDCAELVLNDARICKHCKHEFSSALQ